MRKYKFTMSTVLEVDELDIIKNDMRELWFVQKRINIEKMLDKPKQLIEKTITNSRYAKTYVKIESLKGKRIKQNLKEILK